MSFTYLAATSEDDYVAIAARLAQDVGGFPLDARESARADAARPNINSARFTRFLKSAYVEAREDRRAASA